MPTYDYVCGACEHAFEHFQSMTSNRLRKCPECGERKLERLVGSGAGVIFKGSGFYETDYKRAGSPPPPSESKGDGKGESKAESKSSDASDAKAPKKKSGPAKDGGASKEG